MRTRAFLLLSLASSLFGCFDAGADDNAGPGASDGGQQAGGASGKAEPAEAGRAEAGSGAAGSGAAVDGGPSSGGTGAGTADAEASGSGGGESHTDGGDLDGATMEPPAVVDVGCSGILSCVGDCPDADEACVDACYLAGDAPGQEGFLALISCIDTNVCEDVDCIEGSCLAELLGCFDPSVTGEPPVVGPPPAGSIPAELAGRWTRPGSDDVLEFVFRADGTASHTSYKESTLSSCAISVNSDWPTGSVVAEGDSLTVSLEEGTTSVAWIGGCGTGYTNPAPAKVLRYRYTLDTGETPGLWLTDLDCTGDYCETLFRPN